ncbi:hypothetical protein L3X38_043856 [Prunus dulcis]|uniref:Uncharacterized protein n=1 Tax=Prunus dulcis TaxID=3755 RepID=A0AAD4YMM5_PRUDU|nr:hypothetical protein L3X38_043856 [Prunus dulcis]
MGLGDRLGAPWAVLGAWADPSFPRALGDTIWLMMETAIRKALGNLKGVSPFYKETEAVAMVSMPKEVEAVTHTLFKSMFSFSSSPKTQSKQSGWSLVSNLMHHKRVAAYKEEETDANEFANVDAALNSFVVSFLNILNH